MKKAFIFPGQGSQFSGMGKQLYEENDVAKRLFHEANDTLGFDITHTMFAGTPEELKQTKVTQPAIFIHSTIVTLIASNFKPDMVAGHSLGEFSALVSNKTLSFEDGLKLVYKRALAMQKACEKVPSTMAAVLGLEEEKIKEICENIAGVIRIANYNCPSQLVISGEISSVQEACIKLKEAGARRALILPVGGAFHSPLMHPAQEELAEAIQQTSFNPPTVPIYQNMDAKPHTDTGKIKENLINQLISSVLWTQTIENMINDGANIFVECGPGKVLQGLVKKINMEVSATSL